MIIISQKYYLLNGGGGGGKQKIFNDGIFIESKIAYKVFLTPVRNCNNFIRGKYPQHD